MPDAERYRIEMVNPVDVILRELADKRVTQESVALTYYFIMRQEPNAQAQGKALLASRQRASKC